MNVSWLLLREFTHLIQVPANIGHATIPCAENMQDLRQIGCFFVFQRVNENG